VHVNGARTSGDLVLTWIRRTRSGGDSWAAAEVPLAEDVEAYEVEVLDGPTVKRTLSATAPSVIYSALDQIADFGAPQPAVSVRVHQMSAVWGRGAARAAIV